ncbi:hypothetical protein Pla163_18690 [Planctomycetes bacterium Pla163]|uniref:Uncharacterized protein n=1 Tax=Rohdeia mirabilis TaxID=2528008 RepID=A0A518CZY0_9BACT|nr:hypothetical protein Pla163_18690 [Planctomycetes bacterium Pla163]
MKTPILTPLFVAVPALLVLPAVLARTTGEVQPERRAALDEPGVAAVLEPGAGRRAAVVRDYKDDFMRAYKIGDRKGMARVAKDHTSEVAYWMFELASAITHTPDDEQAKLYDSISRAWGDSFNTGFGDNVLGYFEKLTDDERRSRVEVLDTYRRVTADYLRKRGEATDSERDAALQEIGASLDAVGQSFYDLGDMYHASRAWVFAGDAFSPRAVREEAASPTRELEYLKKALDACNKFDIGDAQHRDTRTRVSTLEIAIEKGGASEGPEAKKEEGSRLPFTFGAALEARAEAETFDDVKKRARLQFGWDADYPTWESIRLTSIGSSATLPGASGGPRIERQGDLSIVVTDEEGGARFYELTTEPQVITTKVGSGSSAYDYTFVARVGEVEGQFLGFRCNLKPTPDSMTVYLRPTAGSTFSIGKDAITVTDDNLDGVFGAGVADRGVNGLPRGVFRPSFDGVFVGKSKVAEPFSEIMRVGKDWYRIETLAGGRKFNVSPVVDMPVGELRLDYKGADLEWVVVRGDGVGSGLFFSLEAGKSVEVPVGSYHVYTGVVREKDAKALMVTGDSPSFEVTAGEQTRIQLGGPFGYDFSSAFVPDGVRIRGESVHVVGVGGEHYHLLWNCRTAPEVHLRKTGSSSWTQVGQLELIDSVSGISNFDGDGWAAAWTPLDKILENKLGDDVEVRLHERKNPLFGRIDSDLE